MQLSIPVWTNPGFRKILAFGIVCGCTAGAMIGASANAASPSAIATERPFLDANKRAMETMMAAMTIEPSGDVDRDFAAMMIPHHQGAIDMAKAELLHGRNEQLRRIAQEIIVDQQQEIVAMHLALGQPLPPPAPDQATSRPVDMPKEKP